MQLKIADEQCVRELLARHPPLQFAFDDKIHDAYIAGLIKTFAGKAYALMEKEKPIGLIAYKELEWDSKHFGFPYAEISGILGSSAVLKRQLIEQFEKWRKENKLRFCSAKISEKDNATIKLLEDNGFQVIEKATTLYFSLKNGNFNKDYGLCKPEDIKQIGDIAYESFVNDRFHADANFDKQKVKERKRAWAVNSCNGYADAVITAYVDGKVAGFVACKIDKEKKLGWIDLIAVDKQFRGKGQGLQLLENAKSYFHKKGCAYACVTTQASNEASMAMYLRSGFKISHCNAILHKWF